MVAPTHALITAAPHDVVAASAGEPARVGRLGSWAVAALDLAVDAFPTPAADRISRASGERVFGVLDNGYAVGVCVSVGGDSTPMVWVDGWEAPTGRAFDSFTKGWRKNAADVAAMAGRPEIGDALGDLLDVPAPDGSRVPIDELLSTAMGLLQIPEAVRGVSAVETGALTDVVVAQPVKKKGLFGFGR